VRVIIILLLEVFLMAYALAVQDLAKYKLKNGAILVVKHRDDTEAVSLQVWFKVGSIEENYQQKGMAHFLEHMLFNGSEKYPYGEIDRLVEGMGGRMNAGTSKEYTFYYITVAKPYWKPALDVLYQLTQKPLLSEDMVEKEKPIVIEELRRGKDDPINLLWEEFEKLVYKASPYRHPIIGYEETISKFTREGLLEFFRNYYQPQNMVVVVVGNVEPSEVKSFVEETFGKEVGKPVKRAQYVPEPEQLENRFKEIKDKRLERAYWIIGWRVMPVAVKDYYALLVLDQILGNGRTSLFYKELVEKGLAYSVSSGDFARPRDNIFVISASFEPSKYKEVKERVMQILRELPQTLTDEEVQKAKQRIINSEVFALERAQREAYYIGYSLTVVGLLDYYLYFESNIRSVRKKDVLSVLEKYILSKPYSEILMVPEK
jgi:predicted Zn-dependent peptidase